MTTTPLPTDSNTPSSHWLVGVLRAARVTPSSTLRLDADLTMEEAWLRTLDAAGLSDADLEQIVANHFHLRRADFARADASVSGRIPEKTARRYGVLPLREQDGHLVIAISDPTDLDAKQALRFASRKRPVFEIAAPAAIGKWINMRYASDRLLDRLLNQSSVGGADGVRLLEDVPADHIALEEIESAPIVKLANVILRAATAAAASDVHLEPGIGGNAVVRLRVDGVLRQHMELPLSALNRLVARFKVLANLDYRNRLSPQQGRARIEIDGGLYYLRIATVPTRGSERLALRIIPVAANLKLNDLGGTEPEIARLRQLIARSDGLVVITGPSGTGRTTTSYAALRERANGKVNVMTVEDAVEYDLDGVTQITVDPRADLGTVAALRAVLKQDPDVVFVSAVEDTQTAEAIVQASTTGHLVLTTLHVNDAVSAIARLQQLGIDEATVAAQLRGAVAQRLLRKLCSACKEPVNGMPTIEEARLAETYGVEPTFRARGCRECAQVGFRGRVPLLEVLVVSPMLQELIIDRAGATELFRAAVADGMRPLLRLALEHVRAGASTLQEVERVLNGAQL